MDAEQMWLRRAAASLRTFFAPKFVDPKLGELAACKTLARMQTQRADTRVPVAGLGQREKDYPRAVDAPALP